MVFAFFSSIALNKHGSVLEQGAISAVRAFFRCGPAR